MAKSKSFFDKPYRNHVGATAMIVACILAFIFICIGTPLPMLRQRNPPGKCYTLWGMRECHSPDYDWRVEFDTCTARRQRLQFGEAFSIIALFLPVFTGIFSWYMLSGGNWRWVVLGLSTFSIASSIVPWAVVAAVYNNDYCGSDTMTHVNTRYGSGFPLLIVGFAVQVIGLAVFVFLER